jgi:hypothetical protein
MSTSTLALTQAGNHLEREFCTVQFTLSRRPSGRGRCQRWTQLTTSNCQTPECFFGMRSASSVRFRDIIEHRNARSDFRRYNNYARNAVSKQSLKAAAENGVHGKEKPRLEG